MLRYGYETAPYSGRSTKLAIGVLGTLALTHGYLHSPAAHHGLHTAADTAAAATPTATRTAPSETSRDMLRQPLRAEPVSPSPASTVPPSPQQTAPARYWFGDAQWAANLETPHTWANAKLAYQLALHERWFSIGQMACLDDLWAEESGFDETQVNPSSGASGIPQALPGQRMASMGADWRTNPATQIRWGLAYITMRYGDACAAWQHELNYHWY